MENNTSNGARALIAVVVFAAFMFASIPASMISAGQNLQVINDSIDLATPENAVADSAKTGEMTGPSDAASSVDGSITGSRDARQPRQEPIIDEKAPKAPKSSPEVKAAHPEKVKATKPERVKPALVEQPAKHPVTTLQSVEFPVPSYAPQPPDRMGIEINGNIATGTWTLANSPYWITGSSAVLAGNTLTIEAGVQVLFNGSYVLTVYGTMNAIGTAGSRISFNTNYAGSWSDMRFQYNGTGTLRYVSINGSGNGILFIDANYTAEIGFCDFTNITGNGIWVQGASVCGINIHNCSFNTTSYAYYENMVFTNPGSLTIGSRIFTNNNVISTYGYMANQFVINTPLMGSNIVFGQTRITWNTIPNIIIDTYYPHGMTYGSVTWGDVIIANNTVNNSATSYGIYYYGWLDTMTDVVVNLGKVSVLGNNVTSTGGAGKYGIYIDEWDVQHLYGATSVSLGQCTVNDNWVNTSGGDDALYVYFDCLGDYMHDFSYLYTPGLQVKGNTIFNSSSEGIYIDVQFGDEMYNYSSTLAGDIVIDDNDVLNAAGDGIYNYWSYAGSEMYDSSKLVIGNIITTNNDVHCYGSGYGLDLYLYEFGYYMYNDAFISVGDVNVSGNTFNSSGTSGAGYIYVDYMGAYMFGNSQAWFGDFTCTDNDFISTAGTYALYVADIEDIGYEIYGNSQVHYGNIQFTWNNIDGWHYGFYYSYYGDNAYDMYDNSYVEIGNHEVNNNTIVSNRDVAYTTGDAFYFSCDYVGYEIWGTSQTIIGHMQFNDNIITVMNGADADGIYISYIDDFGSDMYGTSSFIMTGNIEICRNNVNATPGYYGIYYDIYDMGYYMYGNNYAEFQNFYCSDNVIIADDYGIYSYYYYFGYDMYGTSEAYFGDIEVNNNYISGNLNSYGIYSDWYYFAYDVYGDNIVSFGHSQMNNNTVVDANGYGFYNYLDDMGYEVYGNSIVTFGDFEFNGNNISSGSYGMYHDWYDFAYDTYGNSKLYFGDFSVNDNIINSSSNTGIYWTDYLYYTAYCMYGNSYAEFGNFYCTGNDIISNGYGIYAWSYEPGSELYDNSNAVIGSILWNWNTVNNSGPNDGIYFYMEYLGYDLYYASRLYFGNIDISNNTVLSGGDGIYFYMEYCFYDIYDNATMIMGDVMINDNIIDTQYWSGSYGIYMYGYYESIYYIYDNAHFEMGDIQIMRNDINASSDGIYWYYLYEFGYGVYSGSHIFTGDILVCENNITTDSYGIYLEDWYYVGEDMDYTSYMEMGDIKFNNNTIYSYYDSFYSDDLNYWGYDNDDNSKFIMGNFEICGNYMNASNDDGLYIDSDTYYWGSYLYDNSYFEMGDWLINDNTIIAGNGYGIYFYPYDFGYYNWESSKAIFGNNEIMRNNITATNNGIESWWLYYFGYDMYEDSYVEVGDCSVMNNTINTTGGDGIYLGPYEFGYYVYDSSDVIAGDYIVSGNDITSSGEGIYFYDYYVGYDLSNSQFSYSTSTVTLGNIEVNDNKVNSSSNYGIYFDCEYLGYDLDYECQVKTGSIEVINNYITGYDGIYFYYDEIGYDLYNEAIVEVGQIDISLNTIDVGSNNEAIWFDSYWLADSIYNHAKLYMEDVLIHHNTILNSSYGIRIYNDYSQYLYDEAYAEISGLKVYSNTVNCDSYGLYLEYFSDTTNVAATATAVWPAWEIYNNNFTSDNGIYIESDGAAALPNWDVHDLKFQGIGTDEGIWIDNVASSTPFVIKHSTFDNYNYGVWAQTAAYLRAASCNFTNVVTDDVYLNGNSNVFMIDCGFDKANVNYVDAGSMLDIGWYLTVNVETPIGNRVPYADVAALSAAGGINETAQTNANGQVVMMLREARYNQANQYPAAPAVNFNNHNVTARKSVNTGWAKPEVTMTSSKSVTIILGDSLPPMISGADYSDTIATTGDPFTFRAAVIDDMGVLNARVNYQVAGGGWQQSIMTYNGVLWTFSTPMPTSTLGNVEYYFNATDIGGNPSAPTSTKIVPITDNDAPVITDYSPLAVSPTYVFNFTVTDNIGLTEVYLNYWLTGDPVTNLSMGTSGTYTCPLVVPYLPASSLNYFISAVDTSGNWAALPLISMPIVDVEPPTLISDNSGNTTTTGEQFNFNVAVVDNYNMSVVCALYWFVNGTQTNITLNLIDGNYTGTINVPSNATVLYYQIVASDKADNWLISNTTSVVVIDNDAPVLLTDNSDTTATTGEAFHYKMTASDNIGLAGVHLVYWFGTDAPTNLTLGNNGTYSGTINVPLNAAVLRYYFAMSDGAGNWFVGPLHVITVVDNDAPTIGTDGTAGSAGPGENFNFTVDASDNIGITQAQVIYWFGNGTADTQDLIDSGTGNYYLVIQTLTGSFDDLYYYFVIGDAAGNTARTPDKIVKIVDTTSPTLGDDTSDTTPTAGSDFTFRVTATDGGGIKVVYAVYWTDNNNQYYALLILENGVYVGTVPVPDGITLRYYFIAEDMSGNSAQGSQQDLSIITPEAETAGGALTWLFIIIIVILIVVIMVLLAMRGKGGPAPASETPGEPSTSQEPPAEGPEPATGPENPPQQ